MKKISVKKLSIKELSIKKKITLLLLLTVVLLEAAVVISAVVINSTLNEFEDVMENNLVCKEMLEAIEEENRAFYSYVREVSSENLTVLQNACENTEQVMGRLPFDYKIIGEERYARTWNLINGYDGYKEIRDNFLQDAENIQHNVEEMYRLFDMQDSLSDYAARLVNVTMEQGNDAYQAKAVFFSKIPAVVLGMALFTAMGTVFLIHTMRKYTNTLEVKNEMASQLHKEELAKLEMEKNLEVVKLEVLKSQVNPHFLFNTLNMISGMAKIEDAQTTDHMIISLGNLFRYNLRTKAQKVYLENEIEAVEDYIYIQQMRFDGRIQYRKILKVDETKVKIPSFTLQPLVENSVIHGLSHKEEGGTITLKAFEKDGKVILTIADNGDGMNEQELSALNEKIKKENTSGRGIGLGNICRRISMLYQQGSFQIYSKEGKGTVVRIEIPQEESSIKEAGEKHV